MDYFFVGVKGFLMGICDLIPGVSGGTIAFITGIYDELLDALHGFNLRTVRALFKGHIRYVWSSIHGGFLVSLLSGIVLAIGLFSSILDYLLRYYASFVWSFFLGLILASAISLVHRIRSKKAIHILWFLGGCVVGYVVTSIPYFSLGSGLMSLFFAGAIAIIAMILPGISGSYLLLIMGKYHEILGYVVNTVQAITQANLLAIPYLSLGFFVLGICCGLLFFSRILWRIKEHYHDSMVATLIGFMLGAAHILWPRKQVVRTYVDHAMVVRPLIQKNVLWPNIEMLLYCVFFMLAGVFLVLAIHAIVRRLHS